MDKTQLKPTDIPQILNHGCFKSYFPCRDME